jgi:hypothetical protein
MKGRRYLLANQWKTRNSLEESQVFGNVLV